MGYGQFKNFILDEADGGSFHISEPSVAINPKDPDNIIAVASPGKAYITHDGGKSWTKSDAVESTSGGQVVISDRKGNFYYFYSTRTEEGQRKISLTRSKDKGQSFSEEPNTGLFSSKDQHQVQATTDKKGNIFVTWTEFDKYGSEDPEHKSNILFSVSGNRGKKWNDAIQINQLSGNSRDNDQTTKGAVPAVSADGKIFIAWAYDNKIYLDRSYNDGKVWLRNDIIVTEQPGGWKYDIPGFKEPAGLPVLIADRSDTRLTGMIYLNWSDQRNGENDTDIWFTSSHNGGDTWSSRIRVNDDAPGKHQFMNSMKQDPKTGIIYIIFYDRRNYEDNNTDVYLAYSKNGGRTFKNIKISEEPFMADEPQLTGGHISIDAYDGVVVPVWTRIEKGKSQIAASVIKQEDIDKLEEQQ